MKTVRYIILMTAAVALAACSHDVHDFDGDETTGYLAAHLVWEQADDINTHVNNLHIAVDGTHRLTADFSTKEEVATWLQQLPVGDYDVLVTADMSAADGYQLTDDGAVSVSNPSVSPSQAWFAMDHVTLRHDQITTANLTLQRLMASLSVTVRNVPDDVSLTVSACHVAASVALNQRDGSGRLGLPAESTLSVNVPCSANMSLTRAATQATGWHRLLPTASGQSRSLVEILCTHPDGRQVLCMCDFPRMESGHSYEVAVNYSDLRPYMYFEWYRINDWTESAVINSEVPMPDEE